MKNELERIARILGVKADAKNLCLLIQDKIREKDSDINKLTFTNNILIGQVDRLKKENGKKIINQSELTYIDEIKNGFDKAYNGLKKEYSLLLEANHNLRSEVEMYKQESLMNKIKVIEGVK